MTVECPFLRTSDAEVDIIIHVILNVYRIDDGFGHLDRLLDWGASIRKAESTLNLLLFPPESKVLATVSRHILEVTKFGVAYAGSCDTGC